MRDEFWSLFRKIVKTAKLKVEEEAQQGEKR